MFLHGNHHNMSELRSIIEYCLCHTGYKTTTVNKQWPDIREHVSNLPITLCI